ncbi:MAG: hypothetical protein DRG35_00045 [Deltaproteobacteria bacterium]|nr:hypothetical protein [Deltaproteobacteria bacterium]MBW2105512.1 hypothetical protein [Deltaproteobacteria bacterium]MBW2332683.1 hypothetical protein [Deltaproteobacteria bacterium]MCD6265965.1 hypothetical protein [Deltaproteobacteria bacterium]RLB18939.1 MAG: hypothetical protein DRG35_00045 [Deltaproteobacteria bacterium]
MKDKKLTLEIEKGVDEKNSRVGVSVNVDVSDAEGSTLSGSVLLVEKCSSYEILHKEVSQIKDQLDLLLEKSRRLFEAEVGEEEGQGVNEDMSVNEIWDVLSMIKDPEVLLVKFNSMSRLKRLEVADYVLSHCNVFSGPASIFSMRYNIEEGILE